MSLKVSFVALAVMAAIVAADVYELPRNSYLPPTTGGYTYPTPTSPTARPTPRPTPPPTAPRTPPPTRQPRPTPPRTPPPTPTPTPHDHDHHEPGMPFDFYYEVKDDIGNDFNHNSVSDGDVVRGEYRVLLPDGRTQVVRYNADWKNGYNAVVSYEGTAIPQPQYSNLQDQYLLRYDNLA